MSQVIVYIDRSDIRQGKVDELERGVRNLAAVAREKEPQLISYGFHVDRGAGRMTVVVVHPDSASLELHMEVLAAEFRALAPLLTLRSIEVFGRPSERAVDLLRRKAADLGGAALLVSEPVAAFSRA